MPRYLGIDYLQHAISERRALYNRCLLTVPSHLDEVGEYPHKIVSKQLFKTSTHNSQKSDDNDPLVDLLKETPILDDESILDDFKHLYADDADDFQSSKLETFQFCTDLFEVIPSSNPESDTCSFVFSGSGTDVKTLNVGEDLDRYTGDELRQADYAGQDDDERFLEEVLSQDPMKEALLLCPTLEIMIQKLHPKQVKDPLKSCNGKPITEADVFRSDPLHYPLVEDTASEELIPMVTEVFVKYKRAYHSEEVDFNVDDMSPKFLEEGLSPTLHSVPESTTDGEAIQKLTNNIHLEKEDVDMDLSMNGVKSASADSFSDEKEHLDVLEQENSSKSGSIEKPFVSFNNFVSDTSEDWLEKCILESPIELSSLSDLKNEADNGLLQLEPFPLSPGLPSIIDQKGKEKLERKLWQEDKYFNEILALRLQEPDISAESIHDTDLVEVSRQLQLKPEQMGDAELSLPWDTLADATSTIINCKQTEQYNLEDVSNLTLSEVETVAKYEKSLYEDWRDPLLEVSDISQSEMAKKKFSWNYQNDTSVNSIKDSKPAVYVKPRVTVKQTERERNPHKRSLVPVDPLDDFFLMRMISEQRTRNDIMKSPDRSVQQNRTETPVTASVIGTRRKPKSSVVDIHLSSDYLEAYLAIENSAEPFISKLKDSGDIPLNHSFQFLTPDAIKCMLCQKEKLIKADDMQEAELDVYKSVITLFILCGAANILSNCSLESAISYMTATREKHEEKIGGCLKDIQQKLFKMQCSLSEKQKYHPKMTEMSNQIEEWLYKKKLKSPDQTPKMLLIVNRNLPGLMIALKEIVSLSTGIQAEIIHDVSTQNVSQSLDEYNLLILHGENITEDFPWSLFSLVLEYEHQDDSAWMELCTRQNIRFISLRSVSHNTFIEASDRASLPMLTHKKSSMIPIMLIGSQNITGQRELLHLLESRYELQIIERNFSKSVSNDQIHFADIILDERHCVVLQSLSSVADNEGIDTLFTKLAAIRMKFTVCWLLLNSSRRKTKKYPYTGSVITNIARLNALFASKQNDFTVKILLCCSFEEMASLIRSITDHCMESTHVWSREEWQRRPWLSDEISSGEKFLLQIPCINSFMAQIMLSKLGLRSVLSMSLEEMLSAFPFAPNRILKCFHTLISTDTGLQLHQSTDISSDVTCDESDDVAIESAVPTKDENDWCHQRENTEIFEPSVDYLKEVDSNYEMLMKQKSGGLCSYDVPDSIQYEPVDRIDDNTNYVEDADIEYYTESQELYVPDNKPNEFVMAEMHDKMDKEVMFDEFISEDHEFPPKSKNSQAQARYNRYFKSISDANLSCKKLPQRKAKTDSKVTLKVTNLMTNLQRKRNEYYQRNEWDSQSTASLIKMQIENNDNETLNDDVLDFNSVISDKELYRRKYQANNETYYQKSLNRMEEQRPAQMLPSSHLSSWDEYSDHPIANQAEALRNRPCNQDNDLNIFQGSNMNVLNENRKLMRIKKNYQEQQNMYDASVQKQKEAFPETQWQNTNRRSRLDSNVQRQSLQSLANNNILNLNRESNNIHSKQYELSNRADIATSSGSSNYWRNRSVGPSCFNPPRNRVSIGLAQPQPRIPAKQVHGNDSAPRPNRGRRAWPVEDSPPMDMDSEVGSPQRAMPRFQCNSIADTHRRHLRSNDQVMQHRSSRYQNPSHPNYRAMLGQGQHQFGDTSSSKKARLSYEKVPGARGGQTKLTFA